MKILHTVRISIRSHMLVIAKPFLIVGLNAAIRRMLVITLEAATGRGSPKPPGAFFTAPMIELGLLGLLVLALVHSITLLRRGAPPAKDPKEV